MSTWGRIRSWGLAAREPQEVVAFVQREAQSLGDGPHHLHRRAWAALSFESGVVVGGHVTEGRDLFASQPVGAATGATGQPDVLGLQGGSSEPQELRKSARVHHRCHV
jgi:hypothetical protein